MSFFSADNGYNARPDCTENGKHLEVWPLSLSDLPALSTIVSRENSRNTFGIPKPTTAEHAASWLATALAEASSGRVLTFGIRIPFLAGTCRLRLRDPDGHSVQISYWIAPEYRERGYATAAVRSVLQAAAGRGALHARAYVDPSNVPSVRLLNTLGFARGDLLIHEEAGPVLHFDLTLGGDESAGC